MLKIVTLAKITNALQTQPYALRGGIDSECSRWPKSKGKMKRLLSVNAAIAMMTTMTASHKTTQEEVWDLCRQHKMSVSFADQLVTSRCW